MSENNYRYFFTDAPSPLHEARASYLASKKQSVDEIRALCDELGAIDAYHDSYFGNITGLCFAGTPGKDWKKMRDGRYLPKRNTVAGRLLADRIDSLRVPTQRAVIPPALEVAQVNGRWMSRSSVGWVGDRIFVTIPFGGEGDEFPAAIPDYLKECKRWEFEKYRDEFETERAAKRTTQPEREEG